MELIELKKRVYQEYNKGLSVKTLSKWYNKSISTIYKYISEMKIKIEYPVLKQQLENVLLTGDINQYVHSLSYSDLCLLAKKLGVYGSTKQERINRICSHLKNYSILGLYPEHLNKEIIKRAYKQRAKSVHPDLNKNLDKSGKEFIDLFNAYEMILNVW